MKISDLLEYFSSQALIHATGQGVAEASYYGSLERLLNQVGGSLKPKVRAVINIKNKGAGIPDVGLFSAEQFSKNAEPLENQTPARGVLEIKGHADEVAKIAKSKQVLRYLEHYGQVLVTNYRDFALWVWEDGQPRAAEHYTIAKTEAEFWKALQNPQALAEQHLERFAEFLKRVMLRRAGISSPADVAWFLASYARDAKARLENGPQGALQTIRQALSEALDLKFEGEKGIAVFRSTFVQTLFYGLFSAWVLHQQSGSREAFNWKNAAWDLHLPIIAKLYSEIASPGVVRPLGLAEVLDWATETLNHVQAEQFFQKFEQERAVQYFYEPFLEAYDPELRKQFGVWYTPPEVVRYMVERVDRALRDELGLPLGLADESVYILDPCTGTGSFLLEVVRRIHQTQTEEGQADALSVSDLKATVLNRVFGFEIMPAPYVVAHMQMGLLLTKLGSPLQPNERAGVYLTNALTGWEPAEGAKKQFLFPELGAERDAAEAVKQGKRILVVLGNPPYNAFAGLSAEEEGDLAETYKVGLVKEWGIKKFNLDDLYVRFFRLAERRIAQTGKGVVCYISNYSYLSDPSFVVMRKNFLSEFDLLSFDNLNGDSRETGKLTPEGLPDPSIFSTSSNREGIRVGTTIGLMVRKEQREAQPTIHYREFWGVNKTIDLLASLEQPTPAYETAHPTPASRFNLRPIDVELDYLEWPKVTDLCLEAPYNGPVERRGFALISMEKEPLSQRIEAYFDPRKTDSEIAAIHSSLMMTGNRIVGPEARKKILAEHQFDKAKIVPYPFKPFDNRWCYLENLRPLFSEPSPKLLAQRIEKNSFFITRDTADKDPEGVPFFMSSVVCDYDFISGHTRHFPVMLNAETKAKKENPEQGALLEITEAAKPNIKANLSDKARAYLAGLGLPNPDESLETAELIWFHALAVGYSPAYLLENADGVKSDWPRIPLPASAELLKASAALGRKIAALLDTEQTPQLTAEVRTLGRIARKGGGNLNPATDLEVTAGWGHNTGGVTMPMKGKMDYRATDADERLGNRVLDVYLNDTAYWQSVPERVWEYVIGGYQVVKKWLSYREKGVLGRALKPEEAREVTSMVQRIAALVLLEDELDANYWAVKG